MRTRRKFLEDLAKVTGAVVLLPSVTSCKSQGQEEAAPGAQEGQSQAGSGQQPPAPPTGKSAGEQAPEPQARGAAAPPTAPPEGWDAMAFNKKRGGAGAIPENYLDDINGPGGENKHLGKHLPYLPKVDAKMIPAGFLALMWGDPSKGHAKHPNATRNESNGNHGHWYDWIRMRKVGDGTEELQSEYSNWPFIGKGDNGKYVAQVGNDPSADSGKNTIYLAAIPKGVQPGDVVRVWAHCITHGEYVDFITIPKFG